MCYQILAPFRKLNAVVPMIMHFICHSPSNKTGPFVRLLFSALWSQLLCSQTADPMCCFSEFARQYTGKRGCHLTERVWYFDLGWKPSVWKLHLTGNGDPGGDNFTWSFSANSNTKCSWTSLLLSGWSDNKNLRWLKPVRQVKEKGGEFKPINLISSWNKFE